MPLREPTIKAVRCLIQRSGFRMTYGQFQAERIHNDGIFKEEEHRNKLIPGKNIDDLTGESRNSILIYPFIQFNILYIYSYIATSSFFALNSIRKKWFHAIYFGIFRLIRSNEVHKLVILKLWKARLGDTPLATPTSNGAHYN